MVLEKAIDRIKGKEEGFTLVELLIVVAIIAILAAIAIPQFSAYRRRGYVATLNSDAKNAYTAAAAYFTDYPTAGADCNTVTGVPGGSNNISGASGGYQPSAIVSCTGTMFAGTASSFTLTVPTTLGLSSGTAIIDHQGHLTPAQP